MEFNEDEKLSPEWMNKEFFEKVLKFYSCTNNLINFNIYPATKVGDHFASIMFRVTLTYKTKIQNIEQLSLIVKTQPFQEGIKKEFLKKSRIFDIEMKMYTKTIPEMERLLCNAGDNGITIAPKMLYCSKEPADVIVFEDLSVKGYTLKDDTLNFELSKTVFQLIAKWHACSLHMKANGHDFSTYDINIFNGFETTHFLMGNLEALPEIIKSWDGYEIFYEKFINFKNNFIKKGLKIFTSNSSKTRYNVLNHGDFHLKNMMFKKIDNQNDNVIFFDFQICNWASPAIDIIYGLYIVADNDCREKHRSELISIYYQTFVSTLEKIGFIGNVPTMLDLQMELLQCGFIEAMIAFCFLPLQYIDFSKVNLTELFGGEKENVDLRYFGLTNIDCQNMLKKYIKEFSFKGFLDQ